MSDCTQGGRRVYNAPTHTPAEDRLEITIHFHGEYNPYPVVLNRLDREVDYVEVDGERYERVRTCHLEEAVHQREIASEFGGGYYDEVTHDCDECGFENADSNIRFCGGCGAKVKVDE